MTEEESTMSGTTLYMTVFLVVFSTALVILIGYILLRMCNRKRRLQPMVEDRLKRQTS